MAALPVLPTPQPERWRQGNCNMIPTPDAVTTATVTVRAMTADVTTAKGTNAGSTDRCRIYDRVLSVTTPVRFAGENLRSRRRKETMTSMRCILDGAGKKTPS